MARRRGRIFVAAGTNGAGKSAIAGEYLTRAGGAYFNPDLFALRLIEGGFVPARANALSWKFGFEALRAAIDRDEDFAFETTLGGSSIVSELHRAADRGLSVHLFYVGLASVDLHLERVRARVRRGGHDIPEAKVRERYPRSIANLIGLIGVASQIHVFDNSGDSVDGSPRAQLVFRMRGRKIVEPTLAVLMRTAPDWAKPVVAAAMKVRPRRR
jgi:predicted ABC-type ATPase